MALMVWGALGLPLSLTKAKIGKEITWISGHFSRIPGGICVEIKAELLKDILQNVNLMLKANLVKKKDVRSLEGKLTHVASLVSIIRPFLTDLRGAIYGKAKAPPHRVWTKQIKHVLLWVRSLIMGHAGRLQKQYFTDVYHGTADAIEINLDASPWGIGGYVVVGNDIVSWFAGEISAAEAKILSMKLGDSSCQQTAEALAALVALRTWQRLWRERRVALRVRSDSISALVLVLKLKTATFSAGTTIIAREIALDIASACYDPAVVEHVPGIVNKTCDHLSRKFQPGAKFSLPQLLENVPEEKVSLRNQAYFKTVTRPPDALHQWRRTKRRVGGQGSWNKTTT